MRNSSRSLVSLLSAFALVLTVAGQPPLVAASPGVTSADRGSAAPVAAGGAIVLPNGKVLPPPPAGAIGPSEMAEALKAHAHDRIAFTPGATPQPRRDAAGTASLTLADPAQSQATLIPLAPSDGSGATATLASLPNGLKKQVFGFLPYWMLSATDLQWMRYDLVSTIAYFGVAANSNGTLNQTGSTWGGWTSSAMTNVTNAAHARGDRVVLTVTMMAWDSTSATAQATLLNSSTYRTNLVNNIVATIKTRNADGVNLDFEPVASSLRSQYTSFVRQLKTALNTAGSRYSYLTVCTTAGAATWATGYDVTGLTASGAADAIFVMGYDYSWSGSSRAGGVDPMSSSYMLDVNDSVNDFLSLTTGAKLIWGVPYYGRTWHTTSTALNATTVSGASGQSKAYYYTGAKSLASQYGRRWDSVGLVPWFAYYDSTAKSYIEGYYDDPTSLGVKYDMVNRRGIGGVGMWHLLMDGGVSDLWNLIANKFQADTVPPSGGITSLPPVTDAYATRVSWRAIDVGAGVASYSVQVRDRASTTWYSWLTNTTATSATYAGAIGHSYEFRVSAKDKLGNTQPWVPAMASPGASLAVGGFASVAVDQLNVRSGAGTGFTSLAQLPAGSRVALLSGPVSSGGYAWYLVQFNFTEWPSADYPRTGWAAAGYGTDVYLTPAVAPTVTTFSPRIGAYSVSARSFSPNGDGVADTVNVRYSLPAAASAVRVDILNAAGTTVDSIGLGAQAAGPYTITWDGHTSGGGWAPAGSYLLRVSATDGAGSHVAPSAWVDSTVLWHWGVTADLTPPTVVARAPNGTSVATTSRVSVTFSEPVSGVSGTTFSLVDVTTGAAVAASVSYSTTTRVATLTPAAALAAGHTFRAILGSGIADLVGNRLAAYSWTFSTVPPGVTIYNPARLIHFSAGSTTGYQFDSTGKVIATRTYSLSKASSASASQRSKVIPGHSGAWFYIVNGVW
ncbi:MAG TPA: glycosyl hydrolase family 18 protein, partial [Candidatus Limnocylindria bacterium]|nr:glycosyl hydrolase family 18 protein [Candidatus Limnocylindria bacterium]